MRHTTQETDYTPLLSIDWSPFLPAPKPAPKPAPTAPQSDIERLQAYVDSYPYEITDPTQHPTFMSAIGALAAHRVREREAAAAAAGVRS